ncbi:MAG TPA: nuclear transport factor 2 family protein [Reyranella sp.]|nr:nuclear transport factor 2 family protein [Reyranella sp.]
MASDASRWFELFKAFGRAPTPDSYAAVFHPEGEVADAGMPTPTPASQVREAIAHVLRLMPDLQIDMKRYRARGDAVFVEAMNSGTINGTRVAWDAVYRVHLKDGLVHRGRRFYDQATLFRALRPDMSWLPQMPASSRTFSGLYDDLVCNAPFYLPFARHATIRVPDQQRTLRPEDLRHHLEGGPLEMVDWAGDDTLAFVEWRRGDLLGVDRLEIGGNAIVMLQRYFDTLGMLAEHDPSVTALRAALLSNAGR